MKKNNSTLKKLPVGVQHYPVLVQDKYLYVDKTQLIYRLITEQRGHFLSRPRRFGKSLLVSTLATIFLGKKELFKDTWIATSDYDFQPHPVLWFDFSTVFGRDKEAVERSLQKALEYAALDAGITISPTSSSIETFMALIRKAAQTKEVVILIDEYDHPLLKVLDNTEELIKIRDLLNEFYTTIKSLNRFIRYVFVTGVSKFSKVSLFSGMNNLQDITLDPNFATLAGISETELHTYYAKWIEITSKKRHESPERILQLLREWYNGYCFSRAKDAAKVYNPVSVHLFFKEGQATNFWFGTATPTFAMDLIRNQNYPVLNLEQGVAIGASLDEHHEITEMNLIPLLFQTGYLTIASFDEASQTYHLTFPNEEVRRSFFDHLLAKFTELDETQLGIHFVQLTKALKTQNLKDFFNGLNALFAEIPYNLHLAREAYYHSLIYLIIRALRMKVEPEVSTSMGKLDLIVAVESILYIFEFKFNATAKEALDQIIVNRYSERYQANGKKIILVGASINREQRQIDDWIASEK